MVKLIAYVGALLLGLAPAAALAQWRAAETAHFTIYSDDDEQDITRQAERLESVHGLLQMATGVSETVEPVKVRIYVVRSTADIDKALGLSGSDIAGFYDTNILGPYAVSPRRAHTGSGSFTPELVLHHEYAHHFMLQYFPSVYPQWYVEGFAELIGSSRFLPDGRIGYGMPVRHRGEELGYDWAPVQEVLVKPAGKVHNFDLYGQGWALTHYLTFSKERSPQLRQYLQALQTGAPPEVAARAFGDLSRLNQEASKYARAGSFEYRPVAVKIERPVVRSMRVLSPGEAALIPEVIAFRDEGVGAARNEDVKGKGARLDAINLARIREKAQRFPNDPFALYLLGEAEYVAGNYAQSEAAADRLLSIQPNHVRGTVRKALNMLRKGPSLQGAARTANAAEARRLVVRANRADPNDALPLVAFYQSFNLAGQQAPKSAVDGLVSAVETLPSDMSIRQLLVDELAAQRNWAAAIAYLRPIAYSPHASKRREAAQKQMAKLEAELAGQGG